MTDANEEAIKSILSVRGHKESDNQDNVYDSWKVNDDKFIVREHLRPRCELFSPGGMKGSPKNSEILPVRVTIGKFLDNNQTFRVADAWTNRSAAHCKLIRPWVGTTAFVRRSSTKELYSHSSLNLFTLPGACCLSMRGCNVTDFASPEGRFEVSRVPIVYRSYKGTCQYTQLNVQSHSFNVQRRVVVAGQCTHDMLSHYACRNIFSQSYL